MSKKNFKLTIQYLGTPYKGWQYQPDCSTVQEEIETTAADESQYKARFESANERLSSLIQQQERVMSSQSRLQEETTALQRRRSATSLKLWF